MSYKILRSGSSWAALKPMGASWVIAWAIGTGGCWLLYRLFMYWIYGVPIGWEPVDPESPWVQDRSDALELIHEHKRLRGIKPHEIYNVHTSIWEDTYRD